MKEKTVTIKPPIDVSKAARRGLALHKEFRKGGTSVGVRRAVQLSKRWPVSLTTVKRMKAYFDRHQSDRRPGWARPSNPTKGYIAWLLWGGDPGYRWAKKILKVYG